MASTAPYDLSDIQDRIETLVNNDADTPDTTDDEWSTRLNLINQSIGKWDAQDVQWDELWKTYTHGSVVAAGTLTYTLTMTDMRTPADLVKLTLNSVDSYYPIVDEEAYYAMRQEEKVVYFTGSNKDGWVLNLGWTPATGDGTVGATISFPYYKYATRLSSTPDVPEMSDPNYIIYDVAAAKSLMEGNNDQFSIYSTEANDCMDRMKINNEATKQFESGKMPDIDYISANAILGE